MGIGTIDPWVIGSWRTGMKRPPSQHTEATRRSQHTIGESQSHDDSHACGSPFCIPPKRLEKGPDRSSSSSIPAALRCSRHAAAVASATAAIFFSFSVGIVEAEAPSLAIMKTGPPDRPPPGPLGAALRSAAPAEVFIFELMSLKKGMASSGVAMPGTGHAKARFATVCCSCSRPVITMFSSRCAFTIPLASKSYAEMPSRWKRRGLAPKRVEAERGVARPDLGRPADAHLRRVGGGRVRGGVAREGGGRREAGRRTGRREGGKSERGGAHRAVGRDEAVRDLGVLHGGAAEEAQRVEHALVVLDPAQPHARRVVQLDALGEDGEVGLLLEELRVVAARVDDAAAVELVLRGARVARHRVPRVRPADGVGRRAAAGELGAVATLATRRASAGPSDMKIGDFRAEGHVGAFIMW